MATTGVLDQIKPGRGKVAVLDPTRIPRFFLESIQERHKKWGRLQSTLSDSLPILYLFSDFSAPLKCWNPQGAAQLSHDPWRMPRFMIRSAGYYLPVAVRLTNEYKNDLPVQIVWIIRHVTLICHPLASTPSSTGLHVSPKLRAHMFYIPFCCVWHRGSHKWLGNSVQITGMKFSPGWLNSGQNPATLYHTHMANILVEAFQLFLSKFLLFTRRCRRQVCGTELLAPPCHGNQPIASQDLTAATIDLVCQMGQIFSVITLEDGQEMPDFNSMGLANSHP
ncbi:hypothetical protein B0H10DRAFT_2383415 [Mycena sp. CBHHK59/15]|nr:hypothetical protein B0H10DRAFT_2383415 [Mycena sp. CBHHK59/15]